MKHFKWTIDNTQLTKLEAELSIGYCQLIYDAKLICHYTSFLNFITVDLRQRFANRVYGQLTGLISANVNRVNV
jgi:hypothetical protein